MKTEIMLDALIQLSEWVRAKFLAASTEKTEGLKLLILNGVELHMKKATK